MADTAALGRNLKAWFLADGYIWDWLVAVVLIIINHTVPLGAIRPVDRFYVPTDGTLMYPLRDNTIPSSAMYLLVFAFPGVIFIAGAALLRSSADGHHSLLTLLEGFALASMFKRWMNLVGRLRPNWLAALATGDKVRIDDGHESYPSGHSAYLFFSATVLALWAMGKLRLMQSPGQASFAKLLLCLIPVGLATFVACTRIADYKHNVSDVNAGCFIGISCGLLAYHLNYPSLFSPLCAKPKLRTRAGMFGAAPAPPPPNQEALLGTAEQETVLRAVC